VVEGIRQVLSSVAAACWRGENAVHVQIQNLGGLTEPLWQQSTPGVCYRSTLSLCFPTLLLLFALPPVVAAALPPSFPPLPPPQVQAANAHARRSGFSPKDVHFIVGDALSPPLPDAAYDPVMSVESACYMPDKE